MQFLKSGIIYLASSVVNKALPFLLLPILTSYLIPSDYGVLAIFQTLIVFITPFVGMAMHINITKEFFKNSKSQTAELLSNLLFILFLNTTIIIVIASLFFYNQQDFYNIPKMWLLFIPVIATANTINVFNLTVLRNQDKASTYGLFEFLNTLVNLTVTLVFVVYLKEGWYGRAMGILFSSILFGLIGIIYLYKGGLLIFSFDLKKIKAVLLLCAPLIPHSLSSPVITTSSRFFISDICGNEAVGLYSVGFSFGMIISLFTESFNKAFSPWLYKQFAEINDDKKRKIVRITYLYHFTLLIGGLLFGVVSVYLLEYFVSSSYYKAGQFVFWITLGFVFNGMYFMVFPYFVTTGKTKLISIVTFISAAVNIIMNYFFINWFGALGAAYSTTIAFLFTFVVVWWYSNKIYPMPWILYRK